MIIVVVAVVDAVVSVVDVVVIRAKVVVVVDVDGNLFTQGEEKITSSRKIQVDLSNLNKGVYIVRLNGETVNQSIKIIRK